MSGCFCEHRSVWPARREEVKESVCRMCGVFSGVLCLLLAPTRVQVLEGGREGREGAPMISSAVRIVCCETERYREIYRQGDADNFVIFLVGVSYCNCDYKQNLQSS